MCAFLTAKNAEAQADFSFVWAHVLDYTVFGFKTQLHSAGKAYVIFKISFSLFINQIQEIKAVRSISTK